MGSQSRTDLVVGLLQARCPRVPVAVPDTGFRMTGFFKSPEDCHQTGFQSHRE